MHIYELEMTVRANNALESIGITSTGQLSELTREKLLGIKGIGVRTLAEICLCCIQLMQDEFDELYRLKHRNRHIEGILDSVTRHNESLMKRNRELISVSKPSYEFVGGVRIDLQPRIPMTVITEISNLNDAMKTRYMPRHGRPNAEYKSAWHEILKQCPKDIIAKLKEQP